MSRLAQRWSIPLQLPTDFLLDRKEVSLVAASLARGAVGEREDLLALYEEMEMLAGLDAELCSTEEGLLAWNEYSEERSAHEAAVLRVVKLEERLAQAAVTELELSKTMSESLYQLEQATQERDKRAALLAEHCAQNQTMEFELTATRAELRTAQAQIAELRRDRALLDQVEQELDQCKRSLEQVTSERDIQSGLLTERSEQIKRTDTTASRCCGGAAAREKCSRSCRPSDRPTRGRSCPGRSSVSSS